MANTTQYRTEIDAIDAEILALYERRMSVCEQVAASKIASGSPVYDEAREEEKITAAAATVRCEDYRDGARELVESMMTSSRNLQYRRISESGAPDRLGFIPVDDCTPADMRIVYQGDAGSYSEEAVIRLFGEDAHAVHVSTFRAAFEAVDEGTCDCAVLPIENSTAGVVSEIYDLLAAFECYIVGEIRLPIRHCLLGVPVDRLAQSVNTDLPRTPGAESNETSVDRLTQSVNAVPNPIDSITRIYSHPQSLMQCADYLARHDWEQVSMLNNAYAARKVAEDADPTSAAIASARAAAVYGLDILEEGVNESDTNATRFIVVTNRKVYRAQGRKISLCFEVTHRSGALYHMLSHFIYNGVNMLMIESRPIPGRDWEYRFFVDIEGNLEEPAVRNALVGLRGEARLLKVLGCY